MRGAILGMAILAASTAAAVQAGEPIRGSWRPSPTRATPAPGPVVSPPRPVPVMPRPVATPARPQVLPQPITAKFVKPNYNKRTMALIQQNIAMQAAMRNTQAWSSSSVPRCKASWSEAKLRRKGCLATPPEVVPERQLSPAMLADARLCASAVEGADCGAVRAARDRVANGAADTGRQN